MMGKGWSRASSVQLGAERDNAKPGTKLVLGSAKPMKVTEHRFLLKLMQTGNTLTLEAGEFVLGRQNRDLGIKVKHVSRAQAKLQIPSATSSRPTQITAMSDVPTYVIRRIPGVAEVPRLRVPKDDWLPLEDNDSIELCKDECEFHYCRSAHTIETSSGSGSATPKGSADSAPTDVRGMYVKEMTDTEREYVRDCQIMVSEFWVPLLLNFKPHAEDFNTIFCNIKEIVKYHSDVSGRLDQEYEAKSLFDCMGSLLVDVWDLTKLKELYSLYCSNYSIALDAVERIRKKPEMREFLDQMMENPESRTAGLPLHAFLIKPVQRICKYPLLLRDIMKKTPDDHSDLGNLKKAAEKIETIVDFVNEEKRKFEKKQRSIEINAMMKPPLSECVGNEDREFLLEGKLLRVETTKNKDGTQTVQSTAERFVALFSDILVWAKDKKSTYRYEGHIPLTDARLIDVSGYDQILQNSFELTSNKDDSFPAMCFSAPSFTGKREWVNAIKLQQRQAMMIKMGMAQDNAGPAGSNATKVNVAAVVLSAAQQVSQEKETLGVDNYDSTEHLLKACNAGNVDLCQWLIEHERADPTRLVGSDDSRAPRTLLQVAKKMPSKKMYGVLEKANNALIDCLSGTIQRKDVDGTAEMCLRYPNLATAHKSPVPKGASPSAAFDAFRVSNIQYILTMIDCGTTVLQPQENTWTLLHAACRMGSLSQISFVLEMFPWMNIPSRTNQYPAQVLCCRSDLGKFPQDELLEVFHCLISEIDIQSANNKRETLLHSACSSRSGFLGTVRAIIAHGAPLAGKDTDGNHPQSIFERNSNIGSRTTLTAMKANVAKQKMKVAKDYMGELQQPTLLEDEIEAILLVVHRISPSLPIVRSLLPKLSRSVVAQRIMKVWFNGFPEDFLGEEGMEVLKEAEAEIALVTTAEKGSMTALLKQVQAYRDRVSLYGILFDKASRLNEKTASLPSVEDVAKHLTCFQFALTKKVSMRDWCSGVCIVLPEVLALSTWREATRVWVLTWIMSSSTSAADPHLQKRARFLLDVALHCQTLSNYAGAEAILSGMMHPQLQIIYGDMGFDHSLHKELETEWALYEPTQSRDHTKLLKVAGLDSNLKSLGDGVAPLLPLRTMRDLFKPFRSCPECQQEGLEFSKEDLRRTIGSVTLRPELSDDEEAKYYLSTTELVPTVCGFLSPLFQLHKGGFDHWSLRRRAACRKLQAYRTAGGELLMPAAPDFVESTLKSAFSIVISGDKNSRRPGGGSAGSSNPKRSVSPKRSRDTSPRRKRDASPRRSRK